MKNLPWEPKTEEEWLAILFILAFISEDLRISIHMTTDEKDEALLYYNMGNFLMEAVDSHDQAGSQLHGYKNNFWDGEIVVPTAESPVTADYGTTPTPSKEGAKKFIRTTRSRLLPFCSDGVAKSLKFLRGEEHFVQADYTGTLDGTTTIGNIHLVTSTKNCGMHALYARITGTEFWIFVRIFSGATYEYHRIPTVPNKAESVDLMVMGLFDNVEDGHPSPTFTILYQPQQTPPPAPVV